MAPGSELFGDQRLVLAVAPGETTARVFSRIDGQELEPRKIPPQDCRWTNLGRQVLTWETAADQKTATLRLYDPWIGRDVWSCALAQGSKGCLVEGEDVAVMQPDGRFLLISLRDGRKKLDSRLAAEENLASIQVLADENHMLLVTNRPVLPTVQEPQIMLDAVPAGQVNGRVYAFDRHSGQSVWPSPAVVENYGLPPGQPPGIPVLTLVRNVGPRGGNRTQRKAAVLCLDRRDGRALLDVKDALPSVHSFDVTADLERKQVSVRLNSNTTYQFQFTDEPRPPEPAAQPGSDSPSASSSGASRMTKVAGAVLEAIGAPGPGPCPAPTRSGRYARDHRSVTHGSAPA